MKTYRSIALALAALAVCSLAPAAESKTRSAQNAFGDDPERFSRTVKAIANLSRSGALQSLARTRKAAPGMKGKNLTGGTLSSYGTQEVRQAVKSAESRTEPVGTPKKDKWGY